MKKQTILCVLLITALLLSCVGCAGQSGGDADRPAALKLASEDLMAAVRPNRSDPQPVSQEAAAAAADFALRLFRAGNEPDKNTLLSPLSVLCALAMTANGAKGETLTQMETVLGLDRDALNTCLRSYLDALAEDKELKLANAIWFTADPGFTVERSFLQTNADYYGADIYKAPFDETTLADINSWVKSRTNGMIPEIMKSISQEAVMYLVNALAFDAKWARAYQDADVFKGDFFPENGEKRSVDFMHSEERQYLENEKVVGFLKPYEGGKYAFAALLPKEGVSLAECLASLDGAALQKLLSKPEQFTVVANLPKFELASETELAGILCDMGMELPFNGDLADFSGLGSSTAGNLYISRVVHKTFISVDETGTKAAAATAVEAMPECIMEENYRWVTLDHPFLYLLVDLETKLPFFIGVMRDPA